MEGLMDCFRRCDLNAAKALLTPEFLKSRLVIDGYICWYPFDDPSFVHYLLSLGYKYEECIETASSADLAFQYVKPRILYAILTTGGSQTHIKTRYLEMESMRLKVAFDTYLMTDSHMVRPWSRAFLASRAIARINAMIILRTMRDVGKIIARVVWENRGIKNE
jgi:hypothetical protein